MSGSQMGEARPSYVVWMCILTGLYLVTELAFNARLLDVVGGRATLDEIHRIEIWGRVISGVALMLAVWGMWLLPMAHRRGMPLGTLIFLMIMTGLTAMGTMYWIQETIIERIVETSTSEERYAAARMRLLTDAVHRERVEIANIDLSPEQLAKPEGKSFLALLPVMASALPDLKERTDSVVEDLVRSAVIEEIGSPSQVYNDHYVESVHQLRESYNEYADGSNRMLDVLDTIPREQANAWERYVEALQRRGYRPDTVPRMGWQRVRRDVRQQGVPVADNWAPSDRTGFYRVLATRIEAEATQSFQRELGRHFTVPYERLPGPGLRFEEFLAHPAVQERWVRDLRLTRISPRMRSDFSLDQFRQVVWSPLIDSHVAERAEAFKADMRSFDEGGEYEEFGRDSMKALAVPPIALFISLIGAMVHIFKLTNYLGRLAFPTWRWRAWALGTACMALAFVPFLLANDITQSSLHNSFVENTTAAMGSPVAHAFTWIIQAQPVAYPVNEMVRSYLLGGFSFGYQPG